MSYKYTYNEKSVDASFVWEFPHERRDPGTCRQRRRALCEQDSRESGTMRDVVTFVVDGPPAKM